MDCADAKCKPDEVAIANDGQGDSFRGCACKSPIVFIEASVLTPTRGQEAHQLL